MACTIAPHDDSRRHQHPEYQHLDQNVGELSKHEAPAACGKVAAGSKNANSNTGGYDSHSQNNSSPAPLSMHAYLLTLNKCGL